MMATTRRGTPDRRTRPPLWVVEGLDVVERRRLMLLAVTATIVLIGALLAWLAPGIVPPRASVGAAIAVAALLLGLAAAVAVDATDLYIRGPRHVSAAGGELVAVLSQSATPDEAEPLAAAVFEAREPGQPLLLGLAASGRDTRVTVAWTDALATALEAEGASVLRIDLASGTSEPPGLAEVVHDGVKLAAAVTFGPEPRLARLGAGADHAGALDALTTLPGRLPRDLDVLLVALPMAASRQVVGAVRSLDHVLVVAQRDRTSRVELIAGLDALEAAGTRAQVALIDERTAARLGAGTSRSTAKPAAGAGFSAKSPSGVVVADSPADSTADSPAEDTTAPEPAVPTGDDALAAEPDDVDYDELVAGARPEPNADEVPEPVGTDPEPVSDDPDRVGDDPQAVGDDPYGVSDDPGTVGDDPGTVGEGRAEAADDGPHAATHEVPDAQLGGDPVVSPAAPTAPAAPAADEADEAASDARSADVLNAAAAAAALAQVNVEESALPVRFARPEDRAPASIDDRDTEVADAQDAALADGPDVEVADGPDAVLPDGPDVEVADERASADADAGPVGEDATADAVVAEVGEDTATDDDASAVDDADEDEATAAADDDDGDDADRTDELPRLDGSPPVRRFDDEHEDLLRTTAQLSVLMDDLDDQGR